MWGASGVGRSDRALDQICRGARDTKEDCETHFRSRLWLKIERLNFDRKYSYAPIGPFGLLLKPFPTRRVDPLRQDKGSHADFVYGVCSYISNPSTTCNCCLESSNSSSKFWRRMEVRCSFSSARAKSFFMRSSSASVPTKESPSMTTCASRLLIHAFCAVTENMKHKLTFPET